MFRERGAKSDKEWGEAVEGGRDGCGKTDRMYGAFCIIIHNALTHLCSIFIAAYVEFRIFTPQIRDVAHSQQIKIKDDLHIYYKLL